jgi:hypothetical protein
MDIVTRGNLRGQNYTCICNHELFMIIAFTIIIASSTILLSPPTSLKPVLNRISSLMLLPLQSAYGQTIFQGAGCNCIIDYTSSGHSSNNITGITIPKVKLLKNGTFQSQTEGPLSWIAIKSTQLMGILSKDLFLGNFTGSGTSSTVALNTINLRPNESLGVQISGGTIPAAVVKGEIVKANVNVNGTLGEIKTVGNKTIQFPLHYSKSIKKSVLGVNRFLVNVKEPGYYLLLISLSYDIKSNANKSNNTNNTNNFIKNEQTRYPLIAVYESVLKIE